MNKTSEWSSLKKIAMYFNESLFMYRSLETGNDPHAYNQQIGIDAGWHRQIIQTGERESSGRWECSGKDVQLCKQGSSKGSLG